MADKKKKKEKNTTAMQLYAVFWNYNKQNVSYWWIIVLQTDCVTMNCLTSIINVEKNNKKIEEKKKQKSWRIQLKRERKKKKNKDKCCCGRVRGNVKPCKCQYKSIETDWRHINRTLTPLNL